MNIFTKKSISSSLKLFVKNQIIKCSVPLSVTPKYNVWQIANEFNRIKYDLEGDIQPAISKQTQDYNYNHDFMKSVHKYNQITLGTRFEHIDPIVAAHQLADNQDDQVAYHQVANVASHLFFWLGLYPGGKGKPSQLFLDEAKLHYDGFESLKNQFALHASSIPTNGWTWLISKNGNMDIVSTFNSQTPFGLEETVPILGVDVHEHAYIFDYKSDVESYVKNVFDAINWDIVNKRVEEAAKAYNEGIEYNVRGAKEFVRQCEEKNEEELAKIFKTDIY